jgi:hypothetical protein
MNVRNVGHLRCDKRPKCYEMYSTFQKFWYKNSLSKLRQEEIRVNGRRKRSDLKCRPKIET